jgi:uncharacterized membrane protein YbhN (UPF0104 family)
LGTLASEKAFDVLFLVASGWLATALVPLPPWLNVPLVGGAAGGFVLLVLALAWPQHRIVAWMEQWAPRVPWGMGNRLASVAERALTGLAALRQPRMALIAGAWSVAIWALAAGTNYLLFCAFDLSLDLGAAVFLLVLLHAGVAPPSAPGRLGIFHTLTVLGLEVLGVHRVLGLAYATALHAIVYLPEVVPGAVLLGLRLIAAKRERSGIIVRDPERPHRSEG